MNRPMPPASADMPELTVILPVFNEVQNLPLLWPELVGVLEAHWQHVEVIFVDDVSTDGSSEWLRELAHRDARVRYVRFAGHTGLTAALDAGYRRARAPIVVTMDSDLQSNPADIPRLVAALHDADAATGWRVRRHDTWLKRVSSRIANFIRNRMTRETVRDSACSPGRSDGPARQPSRPMMACTALSPRSSESPAIGLWKSRSPIGRGASARRSSGCAIGPPEHFAISSSCAGCGTASFGMRSSRIRQATPPACLHRRQRPCR